MKDRTHFACGYCSNFSIKDCPEQAVHGFGACLGFEGITGPVQPFVHATGRPCVQYDRAKDLGSRTRFVTRHTQNETDSSTPQTHQES